MSYLNPKKGKHISEDVKEALKTLQKKMIQYEDNGQCKEVKLIEPSIEQPLILGREVSFLLHQDAYELLLNFPKGFKRYELKPAMEFNSFYAMRFYELLSGQKKPLTYSTEKLKTMLKLENKYRDIRTFISRIIDHSKKELDQKSPYTFTYELEHQKYLWSIVCMNFTLSEHMSVQADGLLSIYTYIHMFQCSFAKECWKTSREDNWNSKHRMWTI